MDTLVCFTTLLMQSTRSLTLHHAPLRLLEVLNISVEMLLDLQDRVLTDGLVHLMAKNLLRTLLLASCHLSPSQINSINQNIILSLEQKNLPVHPEANHFYLLLLTTLDYVFQKLACPLLLTINLQILHRMELAKQDSHGLFMRCVFLLERTTGKEEDIRSLSTSLV